MQNVLVRHTLIFPNGGLVIACHNDIRDNIIHLRKTSLLPWPRKRRAPNPLGPHQIWGGDTSQRERPRKMGWRVNTGPIGNPDRSGYCRQFWRCWRRDLETRENGQVFGWSEENQQGQTRADLLWPTGKISSVCPLGWNNDGQGGTSHTCNFDSTHGRKNRRTHFACHC